MKLPKSPPPYRFSQATRTEKEQHYAQYTESFFNNCKLSGYEKMQNFPLFTSRQDITRYLAKYELMKMSLKVHGSIIECGCLFGSGLMWWAKMSGILEPFNHSRRVIGFDTFSGIPGKGLASADISSKKSDEAKEGGLSVDSHDVIMESSRLNDLNRPIGHIKKVELVKGDATKTIPLYVKKNKHLIVSLLYLDFDVYNPTKIALKHLLPRMPKGAVIGFDEANLPAWPGETQAIDEVAKISSLKIKRFPWSGTISYAVIGE